VVPDGTATQANLIEVFPFPSGSVDILELATAADLGDTFTTVPGFSARDNMVPDRLHFPPTVVEQVKVRLRQRNWVEENGKKVFYYGLQELGLKLVDYDKAYTPGGAFGTNHTFIVKVDAPTGYSFNSLFRLDPTPNFLDEDMSQRHVHVRLTSTPSFSGSILWDSDVSQAPQVSGASVSLRGLTSVYAIIQLNFVASSGGATSPYLIGTTPFLKALGFTYTLMEI
jgi:hypothetical protein